MSKQQSSDGDTTDNTPGISPSVIVLKTTADVTWRLFVPTITCTLLGVRADEMFETKPVMMFVGIALGVWLAYILVKRQLKKVT